MKLLITYDVATTTEVGRRRLREVAKICEGYGQRVQGSVFEVECTPTAYAALLGRLRGAIDTGHDSLRIYPLAAVAQRGVVTLGRERALPDDQAWVV